VQPPIQPPSVQAAPIQEKPQPQTESRPQPPTDPEAALAEARTLWRNAIDAEVKGDYASAVRLYEQIRRLPPDVWPPGLDMRLTAARQR
jgi:TPR repeat protein